MADANYAVPQHVVALVALLATCNLTSIPLATVPLPPTLGLLLSLSLPLLVIFLHRKHLTHKSDQFKTFLKATTYERSMKEACTPAFGAGIRATTVLLVMQVSQAATPCCPSVAVRPCCTDLLPIPPPDLFSLPPSLNYAYMHSTLLRLSI